MIDILLCLIAEIALIFGIVYYYDETRFPRPSPRLIVARVFLVFALAAVGCYMLFSIYVQFVRLNANL